MKYHQKELEDDKDKLKNLRKEMDILKFRMSNARSDIQYEKERIKFWKDKMKNKK